MLQKFANQGKISYFCSLNFDTYIFLMTVLEISQICQPGDVVYRVSDDKIETYAFSGTKTGFMNQCVLISMVSLDNYPHNKIFNNRTEEKPRWFLSLYEAKKRIGLTHNHLNDKRIYMCQIKHLAIMPICRN